MSVGEVVFQKTGRRRANAELIPAETMRGLVGRSDLAGAIRLGIHVASLAAGTALIWATLGTAWMIPAMWLHGIAISMLFAPVHECVHFTAFKTRWINEVVSYLSGVPVVLNAPLYRQYHLDHHRYTQDPARDPELTPMPPSSLWGYVIRVSGVGYWIGRFQHLWYSLTNRWALLPFVPEGSRPGVRAASWGMVAIYAGILALSVATGSLAALWYWIVPVVIGQPVMRMILLTEHTGLPHSDDGVSNTRTTMASWPIRVIMWNMPFHAEHHLFPQIPFHALPRAHQVLKPHLAAIAPSYLSTHGALLRDIRTKPAAAKAA